MATSENNEKYELDDYKCTTIESASENENCNSTKESLRYTLFKKAVFKTVNEICDKKPRFSRMTCHITGLRPASKEKLELIYKQFLEQWKQSVEKKLPDVLQEEAVSEQLVKLDKADHRCRHNRSVWRPSGNPTEDIAAHLQPVYHQTEKRLKLMLDDLEQRNLLLRDELLLQKQENSKSMERLVHQEQFIDKTLNVCNAPLMPICQKAVIVSCYTQDHS